MNKKEMLMIFDGLSEKLLLALSESEAVKKQVQELVEENARLRLENQKLQEMIAQLQPQPEATGRHKASKEHLEVIYNEGFHICNAFYGQSRESGDDCIFCMELLDREWDR